MGSCSRLPKCLNLCLVSLCNSCSCSFLGPGSSLREWFEWFLMISQWQEEKCGGQSIFSPSMFFLSLLTPGSQPTAFLTLRSFPVSLLHVLHACGAQDLGVGESLKMGSVVGPSLCPLGSTEAVGLLREKRA